MGSVYRRPLPSRKQSDSPMQSLLLNIRYSLGMVLKKTAAPRWRCPLSPSVPPS